jgi:hypothetical protein
MRLRNLLLHASVLVMAIVLPEASLARIAMPSLEELTKNAKLIVVARVEEIVTEAPLEAGDTSGVRPISWEKRVATARVLEVWKGNTGAGETVKFRASKSWTCDASTAVRGETVVLFLADDPKDSSLMEIASNGIGRLPVQRNSILLYSSLLTKEIKALLSLSEETFKHPVEISTLKQEIQKLLLENAADTQRRNSSAGHESRKR